MSNQKTIQSDYASQNLASAALSQILTIAQENVELLSVMIGFSAAVSQVVTVTRKSVKGLTTYVFLLDTATLSSASTYVFRPTGNVVFKRGDTLTIACANSGTPASIAYSEILFREVN